MKDFLKILDFVFAFLLLGIGIFILGGGFTIPGQLRLPVALLFIFYGCLRFILVRRKYKRENKAQKDLFG